MTDKWETVLDNKTYRDELVGTTDRLKCPGGWIYRCRAWTDEACSQLALCFVPEPPQPKESATTK